jgi:UDP-glucose 4-epimerase
LTLREQLPIVRERRRRRRTESLGGDMKILVTGGAGFIGSHLVEALVRRGHSVRVLDNFSSGRRENLAAVRGDVEVLRGDCADGRAARRAVRGVETVFHEAAVPSVTLSVEDPAGSFRANATATLEMLLAAREAGVRRFIYAGSSSVYGDRPGLPKRESAAAAPLSPYAVGKLTGEQLVSVFSKLYGLEGLTLRYFNVFGARQDPSSPYSGVISLFTTALLAGRKPVIYGDGGQSRDFTHVANVVDANLKALKVRTLCGEAVNIAMGKGTSLRTLLRLIAAEAGRPAIARHAPARLGDIRHSVADIGAARRLLGYRPKMDLAVGLRDTVRWYRSAAG